MDWSGNNRRLPIFHEIKSEQQKLSECPPNVQVQELSSMIYYPRSCPGIVFATSNYGW